MAHDPARASDRHRQIVATYRLQMLPAFSFADAARVVPYLARLGISHLYLSPIFTAVDGSRHGYDVVDHGTVSPVLGGIGGLYALDEALREHNMGLVLDIVPNHIGIAGGRNPWWRDILRYGRRSRFAEFVDVDWEGQPQLPPGLLNYPVLGRPFGAALEAGELRVSYDGELVVAYFDNSFPIAPRTYADAVGLPPPELRESVEDPSDVNEVARILERLRDAETDVAEILRHQFDQILQREPALRAWVESRITALNGSIGDARSFDRLETILRSQPYRLAYWRVSAEEINYRRFFDINELAAICVEHEAVFEATHRLVRDLLEGGIVSGLRVDHVDGLYDPDQYLRRLTALGERGDGPTQPIPVWVEKVLAPGEALPSHWPVFGTTGYDFLSTVNGLFVDGAAREAFSRIYEEFTGSRATFREIAFGARRRVAERSFAGEVNVLALQLHRLAQGHRLYRDTTLRSVRDAIAALLSALPVYRTYFEGDLPRPTDQVVIHQAIAEALQRDPNVTGEALEFLGRVLLLDPGLARDQDDFAGWTHFRRRFQQLSGPVMARGVEDTAFFRFHRLLSLNEVGASPDVFGMSPAEVHEAFTQRALRWPRALSATTTHDTKRSEDARARLNILTEMPRKWRTEVRAWHRANARWRDEVGGVPVPDANTEYYLYQTLVASWPRSIDADYRARIAAHLTKALREAKLATAWTNVNEVYEGAATAFVEAILNPRKSGRFMSRVAALVDAIEPAAAVAGLATLTLKCTAPGIPDFYQGSELPLHTLTDPDNRDPVDFGALSTRFGSLDEELPPPVEESARLRLTHRLLQLRREHLQLFSEGQYAPVAIEGDAGGHIFAFERRYDGSRAVVVVPRLVASLVEADGMLRPGAFPGASLILPHGGPWIDALGGRRHAGEQVPVSWLFSAFPVAILLSEEGGRRR